VAGDLYDTGLKSFESALFFNKQMARLKDAGIGVYLIYGNHDAASKLIKQIRPPSNVHVFRASEAQTFQDDGLRIAIHGQSFATPEITQDLAAKYPPPIPGFFNIGVLHTNLAGLSEHANYAPCSLETLKNKGYQYWALGHVHNRQILCTDPYVIYPGNIQGRNGKEQGEKSCELVTVSDAGAISIETIPTSVVPWFQTDIDASGCRTAEEVYERLRLGLEATLSQSRERVTAVRLRILGTTDAHGELSRDLEQVRHEAISIATECGKGLFWVERVEVSTSPRLNRDELLKRDDPIGEVVRIIASLRQDPAALASWSAIAELQKRLPDELVNGPEAVKLDVAALSAAIDEAEGVQLSRLSGVEAE